ncbi:MAG: choice-of-anchor G family protein, partial [Actinomycetota bacterium]|nr:choice-of-anchor G family protein [Actinomycetota bacterium]
MFTSQHPHTNSRNTGRRIGASILALALASGISLAGAASAQADDKPVAHAFGQFLSGSVLGTDLSHVVSLQAAVASNDGTQATVTSKDPLKATALDTVTVGSGSSIQGNLGDVVQLGAVGQYAQAAKDGTSLAAAGAVNSDGAVGLGQDQTMPGGNATVNLGALLGSGFASNIANLELAINAISAQAKASGDTASGSYTLADAKLNITTPAISKLTEKVNTALDTVQNGVNGLDGSNGALIMDVNKTLKGLDPTLNLLGGNANVTATVELGDLHQLVSDLLQAQYGESGVTFNLETGVVTLDLAKLLGVDINKLPAGTELLSDPVIGAALDNVTQKVAGIADQVIDRVKSALHNAHVTVHADLSQNVAQAPLVEQVCNTVKKVIQVPTQVPIQVPVPGLGGVLGNVLGNVQYVTQYVTRNVSQTVDQLVCSNVSTPLPALNTSVTLDLTGTVDDFIKGTDVSAIANVKLLGVVNTGLNVNAMVGGLGGTLGDQLFGTNGTVTDLRNALNTGLVDPATSGLLDGSNAVGNALMKVLSVKANVQGVSDGTFTETALQVAALGGTDNGGAQINLATAAVGPNV